MANRDLSNVDASKQASSELEYVLRGAKKTNDGPRVSVEQALQQKPVYQPGETRNVTRVLFISKDSTLLNPEKQSLDGFLNLSDLFDEVHILILREGIPAKNPVLRVANNVWLYTASSRFWWRTPKEGVKMVDEQLVFAAGFRPDLIVARDPFESAMVALTISKKYETPVQLHILDDYTTADFIKKAPHNFWRQFIPRFTVRRFLSVRAATSSIEQMISKRFTVPDISVLPRFHNYLALADMKPTLDLKEKYRQYIFFMIFIGKLTHESTLYRAIDAARFVLRNPRVGFLVLGDGPARGEFQKRAKVLGIEKQVIFETRITDAIPYLASANLLLTTDTDADSDEVVLAGAAVGVPTIMSRTPRREDIFEHGTSAYLCEATDVQAFTDRISDLLNDVSLRQQFSTHAKKAIKEKFHQSPQEYKEAYRTSIEQALFIESDDDRAGVMG